MWHTVIYEFETHPAEAVGTPTKTFKHGHIRYRWHVKNTTVGVRRGRHLVMRLEEMLLQGGCWAPHKLKGLLGEVRTSPASPAPTLTKQPGERICLILA